MDARARRIFPPIINFEHNYVCYDGDTKLFDLRVPQFKPPLLTVNQEVKEPESSKILDSIDRAGARIPYSCEIYPSTTSQQSENYERLGLSYPKIHEPSDSIHYKNFEQWFFRWVDGRIIALDTCIVMNHYLSSVIEPDIVRQMNLVIPRFVLLELESIGNGRGRLNKRLAFSAFNEIRTLRLNSGASTFSSPIKGSLLAQFAQITSNRGADSFIRLEIWDKMRETGAQDQRDRQIVLLTRDMIMACTASAENIDTFYFSPSEPEKTTFTITPNKISSVFTETAITFDKIRVEGMWDESSVIMEGMWSGKNISDWVGKKLRVCLVPHEEKEENDARA